MRLEAVSGAGAGSIGDGIERSDGGRAGTRWRPSDGFARTEGEGGEFIVVEKLDSVAKDKEHLSDVAVRLSRRISSYKGNRRAYVSYLKRRQARSIVQR